MKRLGIVITTFNRPEYTKQCFDSIKENLPPDNSLLVIVDDASTDKETIKLINDFSLPNCEVIKLFEKKNRSIKHTLKVGIDTCLDNGCHYITNLDNDAIINRLFYDTLIYLYEINKWHIVTGFNCLTKNRDGSERHKIINDFKCFNTKKSVGGMNMFFTEIEYRQYIEPALIDCLKNGGNWDHRSCINSEKDGKPIICSVPSVVQHIGVSSAMGHDKESPDVADDFQYLYMPDVTLCIVDCVNVDKAIKAINYSQKNIIFGAVKILTHFEKNDHRIVKVPQIKSITEYNQFVFKKLADYIDTKYIMLIQSDGFILNASAWDNDWYNYDYIGATWKWHRDNRVGNGGFSFRSLKLHKALQDDDIVMQNMGCSNYAEDHNICCTNKGKLKKKYGIKYAPEDVADKFSIEAFGRNDRDYSGQFGFHGYELNFKDFNPYEYVKRNKKIISVNLATYPKRYKEAEQVVNALLKIDLIDAIRIYLNEYTEAPEWCKHEKIEYVIWGENLKDTGKFFWAGKKKEEYYFTIDDDIIYSDSYFKKHLNKIKENPNAIITLHGKTLKQKPENFRDYFKEYHYAKDIPLDTVVNFPGTGCMVFDNSRHCFPIELFKYHGMTDLWIAYAAQISKIKCIVRAHKNNELRYILKSSETLWNSQASMYEQHKEILNKIDVWKIFTENDRTAKIRVKFVKHFQKFIPDDVVELTPEWIGLLLKRKKIVIL